MIRVVVCALLATIFLFVPSYGLCQYYNPYYGTSYYYYQQPQASMHRRPAPKRTIGPNRFYYFYNGSNYYNGRPNIRELQQWREYRQWLEFEKNTRSPLNPENTFDYMMRTFW